MPLTDMVDIRQDIHDLMTQAVDIYRLEDPQATDAYYAPLDRFNILQSQNVACLVLVSNERVEIRGAQEVAVAFGKILFEIHHDLGPTRRILYRDPQRGNKQRWFRPSELANIAELHQAFLATVEEVF